MTLIDDDDVDVLKGKRKIPEKSYQRAVAKKEVKKQILPGDYKTISEDSKIKMCRTVSFSDDFFKKEDYLYSLNFYDFEVFQYDFVVTIINPIEQKETIIVNDSKALKSYYNAHKEQIWVGYNSRNYDVFILKGIILGLNPKYINDAIIIGGMKGYQISKDLRTIQLYDFDLYKKNSLKVLEAYMGNDIRETEVPFDLPRALTREEIHQTMKYNIHDVEQTAEVFKRRKFDYDSQMELIKVFDLPISMISLTQAQLTANILGCKKQDRNDEFDLKIVDTIQISKYKYVIDWFMNKKNRNYESSLETTVCGIPHIFAWGGLHGCIDKPVNIKGKLFHVDVTSYYPSLMIRYNLLTRNCSEKEKFKQIYDIRVALKKAGKKKEQAPYKIVLNGTYGICKDKYSLAYDPRQANNVCVNGQLMLLDLLEHLENHCKIVQSNTDGLIIQVEDDEKKINEMKTICAHWEKRTGMGLGMDEIDEIFQANVNNYIFRFSNGKLERKGAYVMELDDLNNDLPIVNQAIVNYLTKKIKVEDTVGNCTSLRDFQKVVRISSNYNAGWHNGRFLTDKTFRVFASKDSSDTFVGKARHEGATVEKFANTPEHCFICNENVNVMEIPSKLDKKWYIDLAEDRIEKTFGMKCENAMGLF